MGMRRGVCEKTIETTCLLRGEVEVHSGYRSRKGVGLVNVDNVTSYLQGKKAFLHYNTLDLL